MFQQLVPLLRQRSVLLTVASLEDNVIPKKLKEGENSALTTPMSFTGTAVELDEQLPDAIVSFVASHLELKNTLARAREEMDAAREGGTGGSAQAGAGRLRICNFTRSLRDRRRIPSRSAEVRN